MNILDYEGVVSVASLEPLSLARLQCAYSGAERRVIHDAVVAAAPACHDLAELALMGGPGQEDQPGSKSRLQVLAELRDMKRRRTKYRVAAKTCKYSDVLRDVIRTQMESFTESIQVKSENIDEYDHRHDTSNTTDMNTSHTSNDDGRRRLGDSKRYGNERSNDMPYKRTRDDAEYRHSHNRLDDYDKRRDRDKYEREYKRDKERKEKHSRGLEIRDKHDSREKRRNTEDKRERRSDKYENTDWRDKDRGTHSRYTEVKIKREYDEDSRERKEDRSRRYDYEYSRSRRKDKDRGDRHRDKEYQRARANDSERRYDDVSIKQEPEY